MTFTLFSVAILFLFATVAVIEIRRAVTHGFEKTLISLGSLIFSAIFSLIVSPLLADCVVGSIMDSFIRSIYGYRDLINNYPSYDYLIRVAMSSILSTVIFVILFFIVKGIVSLIVAKCIRKVIEENRVREDKVSSSFVEKNEKILNVALGLVCAVFISMVITSPFMGAFNIVKKGINIAETVSPTVWQDARIYEHEVDKLEGYSNDIVGNLLYECGGKYMFRAAARANAYGETVYLMSELDALEDVVDRFFDVYPFLQNQSTSTFEDSENLVLLKKDLNKLKMTRGVLADYISECSEAWLDGYLYFLIKKPMSKTPLQPLTDEMLRATCYTDRYNVMDNLGTIIDLYSVMIQYGTSGVSNNGSQDAMSLIQHTDVVNTIDQILKNNPSMQHIDSSVLSMSLMRKYFAELNYNQDYYSFVENLNDSIITVQQRGYGSSEERSTVFASYLTRYLKDFDVQFTDDIIKDIGDYILNYFDGRQPTAEELDYLFRQ